MSTASLPLPAVDASKARPEAQAAVRQLWTTRILLVFCAIAGLFIVADFGVMLWGQNEFSQPESIVAAQSTMLARDGIFYNSLRDYPYTVNAYMPIFYLADAALIRIGVPAFPAGRLISFAALCGIYLLCWRILKLYTNDSKFATLTGTALCISTSLLLSWGTVGQVDTLAVFFALTAFYQYSRHRITQQPKALILAGLFAILAVFTKQTMLAAPTAIFLCLLGERPRFENWKAALGFGACVVSVLGCGVLGWNLSTHGNFLFDTVFANMNPFLFEKLGPHWTYFSVFTGQLVIVAVLCARQTWRGHGKALLVYLCLSAAMFLATAPKIGSDSNYQIEMTILLVLCSGAGLEAMGFFKHLFAGSKTWITLLQLPLAIHMVQNFRITVPFMIARVVKENMFREQVEAMKPYVPSAGRVISTDVNAMERLRGRLDVEPLIYTLLVHAERIDPKPLQKDLAAGAIPSVILYWDLSKKFDNDPEIPGLPEAQLDEIRQHYKLVKHIPGPYLDGVYIYQPSGAKPL